MWWNPALTMTTVSSGVWITAPVCRPAEPRADGPRRRATAALSALRAHAAGQRQQHEPGQPGAVDRDAGRAARDADLRAARPSAAGNGSPSSSPSPSPFRTWSTSGSRVVVTPICGAGCGVTTSRAGAVCAQLQEAAEQHGRPEPARGELHLDRQPGAPGRPRCRSRRSWCAGRSGRTRSPAASTPATRRDGQPGDPAARPGDVQQPAGQRRRQQVGGPGQPDRLARR